MTCNIPLEILLKRLSTYSASSKAAKSALLLLIYLTTQKILFMKLILIKCYEIYSIICFSYLLSKVLLFIETENQHTIFFLF